MASVKSLSVKARGAPKLPPTKEKEQEERGSQGERGSPTEGKLRNAGHRREDQKDGGGCGHQQPVQRAAAGQRFAGGLAAFEARGNIIGSDAVALAFALRCFFPVLLLLAGGRGKSDAT